MPTTGIALNDEAIQRLIDERNRLDLTQAAVAKKIGISQSLIAEIESGVKQPSEAVLKKLCKKYGLRLEPVRLVKKR